MPLEQSQPVIDAADLLLLEIKAFDPVLCQALTGQDNRNALKTLRYCESIHKAVWIRHVLVPGVTLVPKRLEELALFLKQFSCIQKVELLSLIHIFFLTIFQKFYSLGRRLYFIPFYTVFRQP